MALIVATPIIKTSNVIVTSIGSATPMTIVTKQTNKSANIVIQSVNDLLIQKSGSEVTLSTVVSSGRLDNLQDVIENSPTDNSTLVYNSELDKYEVKLLDIDGGIF